MRGAASDSGTDRPATPDRRSRELLLVTAERDALAGRLRRLEAQRAGLVSDALQLAADAPRGPELAHRIEQLVDRIVSLDLRLAQMPEVVPAPATPTPSDLPQLDAIVVVARDGAPADRCVQSLRART